MQRDKRTNKTHKQPFGYIKPSPPTFLAALFTVAVLLNGKVTAAIKDNFLRLLVASLSFISEIADFNYWTLTTVNVS